jgi:hypothetical protein
MANKQIAKLSLHVDPDALREIISSGRLMDFANTAAAQAADQINAQLVQHIAEAALKPEGLKAGVSVDVAYRSVIIDGEPGFGTVPPGRGPHPPVVKKS